MQTFMGRSRLAVPASALVFGMAILTACGTTSSFQTAPAAQEFVDLLPYDRLLVEDFADDATRRAKPEMQPLLEPKVRQATILFADQIASVVEAEGGFASVQRSGEAGAGTLVLRGAITQYDEGSATLRWMVGFNAGNVNFDATLQLVDGGRQDVLGTWLVDKNSWALGGGIAATQTPELFMAEAARKIGEELSRSRKSGQIGKQLRD
jgi:hypothetical protein